MIQRLYTTDRSNALGMKKSAVLASLIETELVTPNVRLLVCMTNRKRWHGDCAGPAPGDGRQCEGHGNSVENFAYDAEKVEVHAISLLKNTMQ